MTALDAYLSAVKARGQGVKIEVADSTGCPVPQFVVTAENEQERLLLKAFLSFPNEAQSEWVFRLHGWSKHCGEAGYASFNFGWAKTNEPDGEKAGDRG